MIYDLLLDTALFCGAVAVVAFLGEAIHNGMHYLLKNVGEFIAAFALICAMALLLIYCGDITGFWWTGHGAWP